MGTNLWAAYVAAVVPSGERQEDIGKRVGQTQATISRWLSGKTAPDEAAAVAAFAKAYKRNVLEAFVAAGFLDEAEAGSGLPDESRDFLADVRKDPAYHAFRRRLAQRMPDVDPPDDVKESREKA